MALLSLAVFARISTGGKHTSHKSRRYLLIKAFVLQQFLVLNTKIAAIFLLDSLPSEECGERIKVDVPCRRLPYEAREASSLTPTCSRCCG